MQASILAFSPEQVRRLTRLSDRQLRYWDQTDFFSPAFRERVQRSPHARAYSFRDVVGLRAIAELLKVHKVPLQRLRKVGSYLGRRFKDPWANLVFYVVGRDVFYEDEEAVRRAAEGGQQVMPVEMARVRSDVNRAIAELNERRDDQVGQISQWRTVAENKPVLAGTRVPTRAIWSFHVAGYSDDAILQQYPQLRPEDVRAAIAHEELSSRRAG